MNNTMPMSTQPQIIDNSFKIKIGPRNIKPEIINLDSDGAPPRPSGPRFDSDGAPMLPNNRNIGTFSQKKSLITIFGHKHNQTKISSKI